MVKYLPDFIIDYLSFEQCFKTSYAWRIQKLYWKINIVILTIKLRFVALNPSKCHLKDRHRQNYRMKQCFNLHQAVVFNHVIQPYIPDSP